MEVLHFFPTFEFEGGRKVEKRSHHLCVTRSAHPQLSQGTVDTNDSWHILSTRFQLDVTIAQPELHRNREKFQCAHQRKCIPHCAPQRRSSSRARTPSHALTRAEERPSTLRSSRSQQHRELDDSSRWSVGANFQHSFTPMCEPHCSVRNLGRVLS